jgi:hypothetical protein
MALRFSWILVPTCKNEKFKKMNETDFSRLFIRQRKIRHLTWSVKLLGAKNTWNVISKPQLYLANVNLTWSIEVSRKSKEICAFVCLTALCADLLFQISSKMDKNCGMHLVEILILFKVKCVFHCESFSKACSFSVNICEYRRCLILYNRRRGKILLTPLVNVWP